MNVEALSKPGVGYSTFTATAPAVEQSPADTVSGKTDLSLERTISAQSIPATSSSEQGSDEEQPAQTWTAAELLEVRARERTFDGAYWRTSIGLFGASLVVLRVFGLSFFPVGIVFLLLGLGFLGIGLYRRRKLITKDAHAQDPYFVTSGGTVLLSGPPNYDAATVENVRQERIRAIKRRYNISLGLQIAFTGVFAALLGYYIWRDRDNRRRTTDDGFVYYNSNWFSWYIGLLIALLVIDLLSIFFTIRNRKRALAWLTNPNTPPHMIMSGMNPQSDYAEVVVIQQPAGYVQTGYAQPAYQNYQPPPP
ncbi:hypothetical protein FBU59_005586, partial [Linderina macrospora]